MHVKVPKKRTFILTTVVLLLSLLMAAPVFAEGETPVEEPPVEETAPVEEPIADADPTPVAAAAPEAPAEAEAPAADESSDSCADTPSASDPYYNVGTTTYSFYADPGMCGGTPNCQDDLGSGVIQYALQDMIDNERLPSDRKLYVEGGEYDGFTINGQDAPQMEQLNGVIGVDSSFATTINNGGIQVLNNTGGFTLSGFSMINGGGILFDSNVGTLTLTDLNVSESNELAGIDVVNHNGKVILDRIDTSNNSKSGTYIENWVTSAPVTVTNSQFSSNNTADQPYIAGLTINTINNILIDGVVASGNNSDGIWVFGYKSAVIKNSYAYFNQDGRDASGYGVLAHTDTGTLTLDHVYARFNDEGINVNGGNLKAKYVDASESALGSGLFFDSMTGSSRIEFSTFNNNPEDGLYIKNVGSIYLNSVSTENNGGIGAVLDNSYFDDGSGLYLGYGSVTVTSPSTGGTQQANFFNRNGQHGLYVLSLKNVNLSNFDAADNNFTGLFVDNTGGTGSVTIKSTLKGWANGLYNNQEEGAFIYSNGSIAISDTEAWNNGGFGILASGASTVKLTNVTTSENNELGLYVDNTRATRPQSVFLNNISAENNGSMGVYILTNGSVSAKGINAFGNSLRDYLLGSSLSSVSIQDLLPNEWTSDTYRFNGTSGHSVTLVLESDNFVPYMELYDESGTLVAENGNSGSLASINYTLLSTGEYKVRVYAYDNIGAGSYFFSLNDLAGNNVRALDTHGVYIDTTGGTGNVTINPGKSSDNNEGFNYFNSNAGHGLLIDSFGKITIKNAAASENFLNGFNLDNPTSSGSVTILNTNKNRQSEFNQNEYGLYIRTRGNILIKDINAFENIYGGADLDNCLFSGGMCQGFGSISILASSNSSNNFANTSEGSGLQAYSKGAIKLVNVNADNNAYKGVDLLNSYDGALSNITITTAGKDGWNGFNNNGDIGLTVYSNGNISAKNVGAESNGSNGLYLSNSASPLVKKITITNAYTGNNGGQGLQAGSSGNITYNKGGAWNNAGNGVTLAGLGNVSVKGTSKETMFFGYNGSDHNGLSIRSEGTVTLAYLNADGNTGSGIFIDNTYTDISSPKNVTITELNTFNNNVYGLWVKSYGHITIKGINAENNGWGGAQLENHLGTGNVSVLSTSKHPEIYMNNNNGTGLGVQSAGNVVIKNVSASWNNGSGIYINNIDGTGNVTLTTTGGYFSVSGNNGYGLYIESFGNVIVKNAVGLYADNNSSEGVLILNAFQPDPKYVKLYKVFANDNFNDTGIYVYAKGYIYASSLAANNNNGQGVYLMSSLGYVTLTGSNYFNNNNGTGLEVSAHEGNITLSNITAAYNNMYGVNAESTSGNISITAAILRDNNIVGAMLTSDQNFTLNKINAFSNGWGSGDPDQNDGIYIDAGALSSITIKSSSLQANAASGIEIVHDDWLALVDSSIAPYLTIYNVSDFGNQYFEGIYVH